MLSEPSCRTTEDGHELIGALSLNPRQGAARRVKPRPFLAVDRGSPVPASALGDAEHHIEVTGFG